MSGLTGAELDISFAGEKRTRTLNRTFRGIDRPTDVLSFPMFNSLKEIEEAKNAAGGPVHLGDIVVCPAVAQGNARENGIPFDDEIRWLLVHGLLHLLGFDHERSLYAARKMRKKETELLDALEKMA
ncbi:MAG: rRNA maturation RNase YbeY [Nitrospiraceae bacterium]|nr:rRNA maturation RNase YbeY [Nitrospiraceae bacterium]